MSRTTTAQIDPADAPRQTTVLACATVIVLATVAALWPVVTFDFTNWDDDHTVAENGFLLPPTGGSLWELCTRPRADLWVPVTYATWWALAKVALVRDTAGELALRPWPFHAANLALHVLSALAVFGLLLRLVRRAWAACAGALLFALHPIQVEAVAWVSGLKDVLAGLLSIVCLWKYVVAAQQADVAPVEMRASRATTHYAVALTSFLAAILAKPSAVAVPVMLLAIELVVLRRLPVHAVRGVLPFVVFAIPVAIAASKFQPAHELTTAAPVYLRPLVAADAWAFYLYKLTVPLTYALDYGRTPREVVRAGHVWFTWLAPLLVFAVAFALRRRAPLVWLGALMFVIALLPVSGLARFDFQEYSTVGDHYAYLALAGAAVAAAALLDRARGRAVPAVLSALILAALGARSFAQTWNWRDSENLFRHTLVVNPRSWVAGNNLAQSLITQGRLDEAEQHLRRSLELRPQNPDAHVNLGNVHARRDQYRAAIDEFRTALELNPRSIEARMNLGASLGALGDIDAAIRQFGVVLQLDPGNKSAKRLLDRAQRYRAALSTTRPRAPATSQGSR